MAFLAIYKSGWTDNRFTLIHLRDMLRKSLHHAEDSIQRGECICNAGSLLSN